jgi:hypothetical protein
MGDDLNDNQPREFREALSIEQQAEALSLTSRKRFLDTLARGAYPDVESQHQLWKFYRVNDSISRLEALLAMESPVLTFRNRKVPNPLVKMIGDQYKESARYFRMLGLDQEPRGGGESQGRMFR